MAREQTLVLIKPDAAKRRLTGMVLDRLDAAGLMAAAAKMVPVSLELAKEHYAEHEDKPFYPCLLQYIRGEFHGIPDNRVLALVYEGEDAIAEVRRVAGATNPEKAEPGTIRGSFGRITTEGRMENLIHASANAADAEREIKLWFRPGEVLNPAYPAKKDGKGHRVWA